jgi:hypothetical protein
MSSMDDTQRKDLERAAAFLSPKTDADCCMDSAEANRLACVLRSLAAANKASALPLPEGWKLVPATPTEEMLDAACDIDARGQAEAANLRKYPTLMPFSTAGEVFEIQYRAALSAAPLLVQPPDCNQHPDAPHGFNRNASHNAGRYVCDCEGWEPAVQPEGGE